MSGVGGAVGAAGVGAGAAMAERAPVRPAAR